MRIRAAEGEAERLRRQVTFLRGEEEVGEGREGGRGVCGFGQTLFNRNRKQAHTSIIHTNDKKLNKKQQHTHT